MLNVTIFNDDTMESNESFNLAIRASSLPINVKPGDFAEATVIIEDDDGNHIICTVVYFMLNVHTYTQYTWVVRGTKNAKVKLECRVDLWN